MKLPPWAILHIPHDSIYIPPDVRKTFLLNDQELNREILAMTDGWTHALFGNGIPASQIVIAPVSRLVVDTERFEDDRLERMAGRGMGVIYTATHRLTQLRRAPSQPERRRLLDLWYRPHHQALTQAVDRCLARFGKALVIDAHSFPSRALPYEDSDGAERPEICIGTDGFHTPAALRDAFAASFSKSFSTGLNSPFAGALVPMKHYGKDPRVMAVMIETRRDLYQNEDDGSLLPGFVCASQAIAGCAARACRNLA